MNAHVPPLSHKSHVNAVARETADDAAVRQAEPEPLTASDKFFLLHAQCEFWPPPGLIL